MWMFVFTWYLKLSFGTKKCIVCTEMCPCASNSYWNVNGCYFGGMGLFWRDKNSVTLVHQCCHNGNYCDCFGILFETLYLHKLNSLASFTYIFVFCCVTIWCGSVRYGAGHLGDVAAECTVAVRRDGKRRPLLSAPDSLTDARRRLSAPAGLRLSPPLSGRLLGTGCRVELCIPSGR